MASVENVLDQVDGLRRDAAERVEQRFATVDALASATIEQLTEISGIGQVMADRIHAAAAGAKGGEATAAARQADAATPPAGGGGRGLVGKVVETATGTARTAVDRAAPAARKAVDRAAPAARKVVDRVVKRGR